jgi:phosphoribosylaminoimidazole (AIR) synthetase
VTSEGLTYAAAGVDTEAGDKAVELMKDAVRRTQGPAVLGGVGGVVNSVVSNVPGVVAGVPGVGAKVRGQ